MRNQKRLLGVCCIVLVLAGCGGQQLSAPRVQHVGSKADGRLLFAKNGSENVKDDGIYVIENGGKPRQLIKKETGDYALQYPRWSPDGSQIAYVRVGDRGIYSDLILVNLDGSNKRTLTSNKSKIVPGTTNIDLQKNYVLDSSIAVGLSWSKQGGFLTFASDKGNGTLLRPWISERPEMLKAFDPGLTHAISATAAVQQEVDSTAISPDGKLMAFSMVWQAANDPLRKTQIYLLNLETKKWAQLSDLPDGAYDPTFSPDGRFIAFAGRPAFRVNDIYIMTTDGKNVTRVTETGSARAPTFSPDGKRFAFLNSAETNQFNVWAADVSFDPVGAGIPIFGRLEKVIEDKWIDSRSGLSWWNG